MLVGRRTAGGKLLGPEWPSSLKSGLVHLWEFNEDANDIIGGVNLSITGNVTYVAGKMKMCAYLNGGYLMSSGTVSVNAWTVSFWLYLASMGSSDSGIICRTASYDTWGLRINNDWNQSGEKLMFTNGANITSRVSPVLLPKNQWAHVIARLDGNCCFFNGVKYNFVDGSSVQSALGPLNIGSPVYVGVDNYNVSQRAIRGRIEQLAIWGRALSDSEVAQLYNGGAGLT